jgi:pimeloyl-ACP methyl ester carboxylesterase
MLLILALAEDEVNVLERSIRFVSADGTELEGTLTTPDGGSYVHLAILMPGIDVDREEEGFYTGLSRHLADAGVASYRFDWRCHGHDSDRSLQELTLAGLYNDLDAAVRVGTESVNQVVDITIVAASFSGGVAANWSRRHLAGIASLVLLAPILDYVHEYIVRAGLGSQGGLNPAARADLRLTKAVNSWGKQFSQQIVNEFFALEVVLPQSPCFVLHGGADSGVDIAIPQRFVEAADNAQLVVVAGADHGFCLPGDDALTSAETASFYEFVFQEVTSLVTTGAFTNDDLIWRPRG